MYWISGHPVYGETAFAQRNYKTCCQNIFPINTQFFFPSLGPFSYGCLTTLTADHNTVLLLLHQTQDVYVNHILKRSANIMTYQQYIASSFVRWWVSWTVIPHRFRSSMIDATTPITGSPALLALSLLQLFVFHLFPGKERNVFPTVSSVYVLFTIPMPSFCCKTPEKTRYIRH